MYSSVVIEDETDLWKVQRRYYTNARTRKGHETVKTKRVRIRIGLNKRMSCESESSTDNVSFVSLSSPVLDPPLLSFTIRD